MKQKKPGWKGGDKTFTCRWHDPICRKYEGIHKEVLELKV